MGSMMRFGSDPELFVMAKGGRKATSAHMLDFKEYTSRSTGSGNCRVKLDGFALELNPSAGSCRDYQVPNMGQALKDFYRKHPDWKLSAIPVMELTQESLVNAPEDVLGYGCVPDRDAYRLEEKTPPTTGYPDRVRYTGGHIHITLPYYSKRDFYGPHEAPSQETKSIYGAYMVMLLDVMLGVPFVSVLGHANDYGEATRRRFYGQAGSYRLKEYGVEYRVLSGALMLSPILYTWAIGQMRNVVSNIRKMSMRAGYTTWQWVTPDAVANHVSTLNGQYDFARVQAIINNHDVNEARLFMREHNIYENIYNPEFVNLAEKADDAGIAFNTNLYQSWRLNEYIQDHAYVGVEGAMKRKWDNALIFPHYKLNDYTAPRWGY